MEVERKFADGYFHISKDEEREEFELYQIYIGSYNDSIYLSSYTIDDIIALRNLLNKFIEMDGEDVNEN